MSLHVISDALIALAYFTIPISILRFVRGRNDLQRSHLGLAFLFAAFIALCGLTHVVSIVVLWVPIYIIEGWIKAATAIVSVATAGWLIALVPLALKLPSVNAMQREIAARRETESDLRAAERLIEVMPGLIYVKDRSGRMLVANKATLDLIGKQWTEVEGKRDIEVLANPRQAEMVMENDRRIMDAGTSQELEEIIVHSDKGPRVYLSTKVPFDASDEGTGGIVGLSIDVTERSKNAKELLRVARRTAMGDMAAALAHEINQPLAAISMYLAGSIALLANDSYEGPLTRSLALANDQCLRAGEIIRRVRTFISGGDDVQRAENAALLVDEACSLALLGSRDSGIAISIEHDSTDILVLVDRLQIEQVIINLVRNAMDAMGDAKGMALRVKTSCSADGMAMVSVSDTGPGISAEVIGRLFEPFVSTKGVKGMGVGLSISRTIIENHGGKIWADPSTEGGTTFHFILPSLNSKISA
jgi:two-component system sensor kinase FixL